MKKEIIGFLVCTLLIGATVLPVAGTIHSNETIKEDANKNQDLNTVESFNKDCSCKKVNTNSEAGSRSITPNLKWHWDSKSVFQAPMVTPDLNGDNFPDIVFVSASTSWMGHWGKVRAISGATGSNIWSYNADPWMSPAVGDIDLDGDPEILVVSYNALTGKYEVRAISRNGNLLWSSVGLTSDHFEVASISIADLDQDGTPEIIAGKFVLDTGGGIICSFPTSSKGKGFPCIANTDCTGNLEIVAGNTIYSYTGVGLTVKCSNPNLLDGFNAIGNFDNDLFPEIVLLDDSNLYLLEDDLTVKYSISYLDLGDKGFNPTVEDFDSDGLPEIGFSARSHYLVYNHDLSLLWSADIWDASTATAGTVYDLDGDGLMEVIYGDEKFLHIFDGQTGTELWKTPNPSDTIIEYPVIADIDNDDHVEIVAVCSFTFPDPGGINIKGVRAWEDDANWTSARKIWNEYSYHITNVNDDGTIPQFEQNNWEIYNNYRCQLWPNSLNLSKDDGVADDECVCPCDVITYTICYDNLQNNFAVHNVVINDTLPPEVNFLSASHAGSYHASSHSVNWTIGSIGQYGSGDCLVLTVQINETTPFGTIIHNKVNITSDQTVTTMVSEYTKVCSQGVGVVSTESDEKSAEVSLAVGSDGSVHVVWMDPTDLGCGDDWDILYKYKPHWTNVWSATEVVSTESTGHSGFPSLAVDKHNVHVAWADTTDLGCGDDRDIFYKKKIIGTPPTWWSATEVVSTESNGDCLYPSLDVSWPTGTVHIAWMESGDIFYKNKTISGPWPTGSGATELVSTETGGGYPSLAIDYYTGTVNVAWQESGDIFYKNKTIGGSWPIGPGATELVSTETGGHSSAPSLAVNINKGRVHIAWMESGDIFYKNKTISGPWPTGSGATELVSTETGGDWPSLAVDSKLGTVHVAWHKETDYGGSGSDLDIFYKNKTISGPWPTGPDATELVSACCSGPSMWPSLDVKYGQSAAYVAWEDRTDCFGAGPDWDIFYNAKPGPSGSWHVGDSWSYSGELDMGSSSLDIPLNIVMDEACFSVIGIIDDPEEPYEPYYLVAFGGEVSGSFDLDKPPITVSADTMTGTMKIPQSDIGLYEMTVSMTGSVEVLGIPIPFPGKVDVTVKFDEERTFVDFPLYLGKTWVTPSGDVSMDIELTILGLLKKTYHLTESSEEISAECTGRENVTAGLMTYDAFNISYGPLWVYYVPSVANIVKVLPSSGDVDGWIELVASSYPTPDSPWKPETPSGETNGTVGNTYIYSTRAMDPNDDQLMYGWDWDGDMFVDEWTGFYDSNVTVNTSHTWTKKGTYSIRVKARDTHGLESPWSDPLPVTMPVNQPSNQQSTKALLKLKSLQQFSGYTNGVSNIQRSARTTGLH